MNTIIKGRITGQVEITVTPNGNQVANFRIAENKAYIDSNGKKQRVTNWYDVSAWHKVAESIQDNCRKGDLVKFKVNVQPNSYFSDKKQTVVNELVYTANRFKIVRQARGTDQPIPMPQTSLN